MSLWQVLRDYRKTHKLSARLLGYILLISSLLTLLGSGVQLYNDYLNDRNQITQDMKTLEESFLEPLANSIWNMDGNQVKLQLQGAMKMRDMVHLEVFELRNGRYQSLAAEGSPQSAKTINSEFTLRYYRAGFDVEVGKLQATFTLAGIYERLQHKVLIILGTQFVKTFIVSFCIIFITYLLITRHLHHLSRFAANINFHDLSENFKLKRRVRGQEKDELDHVVDSINILQQNLRHYIAERNSAEAELQEHKRSLEDKVTERTQALEQSLKQLEHEIHERKISETRAIDAEQLALAASHAKSEFLANMSHEIRTPMNSVIGLSYLMQRTQLVAQQRDYINKIGGSAHSLLGIIDDILDFSKIEAGELSIEETEFLLGDVLQQVSNVSAYAAFHKGLRLEFHAPASLLHELIGDPLRLGQVLKNLVSNAIKFTDRGCVSLSVSTDLLDGDEVQLQFSVRDTGIGISREQQTQVFQAFKQADGSTTRQFGGSGLGLAICQRLVTLMGGDISLESLLDVGSVFRFTVTLRQQQSSQALLNQLPAKVQKCSVVLIVDDTLAGEELSDHFSQLGFEVNLCRQWLELEDPERHLKQKQQAIVVVDFTQTESSFDAVLEAIDRYQIQPLILGYTSPEGISGEVSESKQARIDYLISEPIFPARLVHAIDEACQYAEQGLKPPTSDEVLRQLQSSRVLVVDDQPINVQIVTDVLEDAGVNVTSASNGAEAVDIVSGGQEIIDIILMDVQMPVMDGYEATRQIRQFPQGKDVPIIALTAHSLSGDRDKCLQAGMNDYISKPIDIDRMIETIARLVSGRIIDGDQQSDGASSSSSSSADSLDESNQFSSGVLHFQWGIESTLKHRFRGHVERYRKMLESFANDYPGLLSSIRAAIGGDDLEQAELIVHSLKGLGANLGAEQLASIADVLLEAIKQGAAPEIQRGLESLLKTEADVLADIAVICKQQGG